MGCDMLADIDLESNNILIYGKGAKERVIQIGNKEVIAALKLYKKTFEKDIVLKKDSLTIFLYIPCDGKMLLNLQFYVLRFWAYTACADL